MANVLATALERRQATDALRETVLFKEELLTLLPAGFYSCDAEGRITSFNRRANFL
jgi:PAS domain-containing protein